MADPIPRDLAEIRLGECARKVQHCEGMVAEANAALLLTQANLAAAIEERDEARRVLAEAIATAGIGAP